jgi:hypothetical protein
LLAACGGTETGMSIAISRAGISPEATQARIQVNVSSRTCDDVKGSGPEKRATHKVDIPFSGAGGSGEIHEIRASSYTVSVWTLNAELQPFDFGCEESIRIRDGEMAEVTIDLFPYP